MNLPCPLRGPIFSPPPSITTSYSRDSPAQPSLSCKLQVPHPARTPRHVSKLLCLLLATLTKIGSLTGQWYHCSVRYIETSSIVVVGLPEGIDAGR